MTSNDIIDFNLSCPHCEEYCELGSIADGEEKVTEGNLTITRSYWICPHCGGKIFPKLSDIRK